MKVLFSLKDLNQIVSSMDIEGKDSLKYRLRGIVDRSMEDYPKYYRMVKTYELFSRLLDDSYGQFAFSRNNDILICSMGEIRLFGSEDKPYYGNVIFIFVHDNKHKEWFLKRDIIVEDLYPEHVAFRPDTMKMIMNLTKSYMKKFSAIVDSFEKVEKLARSIKEK